VPDRTLSASARACRLADAAAADHRSRTTGFAARSLLLLLLAAGSAVALPPPGTPVVVDAGTFTRETDRLTATWAVGDPGNQIVEFQYRVTAQSANGPVVRDWTSAGLERSVEATGLSLTPGQSYFISVRAKYGAEQLTAAGSTNGITVDNAGPVVSNINDGGNYTKSPSMLTLSWTGSDTPAGVRGYRYSVGTSPGATDVKPWTSVGTRTSMTITGLNLVDGVTYYGNIEATDKADNVRVVSANGIVSDRTPPTLTVQDDGTITTNGTMLHATWSGSDALSGIAEYQYAVGTSGAPESIVPWTSRGLQTSVTVTGLQLQDGVVYFFRVKAIDKAGNSVMQSTDGIKAQLSGPKVHSVIDAGQFTPSSDSLKASWVASGGNITEYRYAIGTSAGATDVVPWTSTGLSTSVTRSGLSLQNGQKYYFTVRAYDDAGRYGSASSDGILVDLANPVLGGVVDEGAFTADKTRLTFSWSGSDGESGIKEYKYAIGTQGNPESVVPWTSAGTQTSKTVTGLTLSENVTYYVSVYALDQVGHVTFGLSDGIGLDVSAPKIVAKVDSGAVTQLDDELSASWAATDPMGIESYRFAIGTSPGADDVSPWTDAGQATGVTVTGLTLEHGLDYYFSVSATDVTGRMSQASFDGIRLDDGSPFVIDDVRMGDPNLCYTNPEFTGDGEYVVWGERIPKLNEAGEGILKMWHCAVDQETGAFIPWDCKGHSGFESTDWGRAYLGRDRQGWFYVGADANYRLVMTRITGPDSGVTIELGTLADRERRAIYPTQMPDSDKVYVYWLKSHGTSVRPGDAEWVELRYIDIDDPTNEIVVDHQVNTEGLVPMDITFPRWAFQKPILLFGRGSQDGTINMFQIDASQPESPMKQLTNDRNRMAGPYPVLFEGKRYIISGVNGSTESLVYRERESDGMYEVVESFVPPANETFGDPCLANSHEPFIMNGKLFTSSQITDCGGNPPEMFAFLSQPGEIWFTELLVGDTPKRISFSNTDVRNEPEPVVGTHDAWVFYTAYPFGYDQTNACSEVRRAATPAAAMSR
jgi:hypothetical protein